MALPIELEDWLTEEGDRIVHQMAAGETASNSDSAIYEIWLLDTEIRNGGVAQHFDNRGCEQWHSLSSVADDHGLKALKRFIDVVDTVIAGVDAPYDAVIDSDVDLDDQYAGVQTTIVTELRDSTVA